MDQQAAKPQIDDLLFPFLHASNEAESIAVLEQLICNLAQPLIRNIIHFKLNTFDSRRSFNQDGQELEDLSNEVIVRLVRTLRECKDSPQEKTIASLRSYVAVMAYNASDEYLRHKYPRRFSLKNKLRYILTHKAGLALWEIPSAEMLCGFASWQQTKKTRAGAPALGQTPSELEAFLQKSFPGLAMERVNLAELLQAVLEFLDSPIEIDELVTCISEILGLREVQTQSDLLRIENDRGLSSDPRERLDEAFDHRARLEKVWQEVLQLPPRQRTALLLNLRDEQGESAIAMLPILRIASLHQIAAALDMSAEELAAIWNELPLEDATLAERMGASRQQIINLRKCARERLTRRLLASGG
jgi:RNA polymerase sigma factor (sigma-70 family)